MLKRGGKMTDLILYVVLAIVGYILASRLRNFKDKINFTGKVQTVTVLLLVLSMGLKMGSNDEVIENLNIIGVYALVFTILTMAASIFFIFISRKLIGMDRQGHMIKSNSDISNSEAVINEIEEDSQGINKMTLGIVIMVTLGLACGYFFVDKIFTDIEYFNWLSGLSIKIGLSIILFFVGFDMGLDGTFVEDFKKVGIKVMFIPLATFIGTMIASVICGLFMPISMKEALAIGAGLGWYSFAPVVIMEKGYVTASAISFMHNIFRELFSILFIPLVAKKIGFIETIGMPASASGDVCLPIITRATRSEIAIYSFISGISLSAAVTILVPIIIS